MVRVSDELLTNGFCVDAVRIEEQEGDGVVLSTTDILALDLADARTLLRDAAEALQECRVAARVGDYQHRIERIDATTKPIIARIEGGAS